MRKHVIYLLSILPVTPVAAEGFPTRPESCQLVSTAQFSDCEVQNRYRCQSGDNTFYWVEFIEAEGLDTIAQDTADFLPMSVVDAAGDGMFFSTVDGLHPREMIQSGTSTQRLEGQISLFGLKQPFKAEVKFRATGETITLAERSFQTIEGEIVFKLPNAGATFSGTNTIAYQPEIDLMIETETWTNFGSYETTYVVEYALPGQAGFGDEYPKHGCMTTSSLKLQSEGAST